MKETAVSGTVEVDPADPRAAARAVVECMLIPGSVAICEDKGPDFALVYWGSLLAEVAVAAGQRVPEIAKARSEALAKVVDGGQSRH